MRLWRRKPRTHRVPNWSLGPHTRWRFQGVARPHRLMRISRSGDWITLEFLDEKPWLNQVLKDATLPNIKDELYAPSPFASEAKDE